MCILRERIIVHTGDSSHNVFFHKVENNIEKITDFIFVHFMWLFTFKQIECCIKNN